MKLSTVEGEAVALLEVVKIASNRCFGGVVFESDSQIQVNAIYLNVIG